VPTNWSRTLEYAFLGLLQATTAGVLWRASKRADAPPGYQMACRWLALSWSLFVLAALVYPFTARSQNADLNLGVVDIFYLATYPVIFIGLSRLPKADPPLPSAWRILLDGTAFIVGVGLPVWVFAVHPALVKELNLLTILSATYPTMALIGILVMNSALLRTAPFPSRTALNLLLAGIFVSWLADLMFAMEIAQSTPLPGLRYWVNISNALSLALALVGSWRILTEEAPTQPQRPVSVSPVPMVTILFVSLGLGHLLFKGSMDGREVQKVLAGALPLIIILLLRETLAVRETSRLAAEAATAHLQARFEALVRYSSDLLLVLDHQGLIGFASPAASRIMGVQAEALNGRPLTAFLHPEDVPSTSAFLSALLGSYATLTHQCRVGHRDGSWRVLDISGSNLLDDPTVHGLVLNSRDITERHRLEDQLMEAQKMEAVGRLAGGVAHDFNNLLGAILGNLELAELSLPPGHIAGRELKRIHSAATRGAVLTSRLLAFCRKDSPESKVVDPRQLLLDSAPLMEGLLGEQVRLVLDLEPNPWPITLDPNELEQALLNLAANARDAMPTGGSLTLRLKNQVATEPQITPFLPIPAGEMVVLEVADTGTGMSEATLQHLFEPFFTTKGRGKGTGLGLASVYGFVKASLGGIAVDTQLGRGTTIRLAFPRSSRPIEAESLPSDTAPLLGKETVLLVEDDPSIRETTQRILAANGYTVLDAGNADEARIVFQFHNKEIQILITDVIMPGDSGPVLAAELVATQPGLRVLYISGYTADELGPHGLARPDAPLLRKPFTVGQLTRRLRSIMAGPPGRY
jgi:PAS domain S-box-containing protein